MTNKQKQCLLTYWGLLEPKEIDGIWGPRSAQATRKLQKKLGLEPEDGIFGMNTEDECLEAMYYGYELPEVEEGLPSATGTFWDKILYFDRSEFVCTCGGRGCNGFHTEPVEQLVRNLDAIRIHFGKVVIISSGVRCQLRNSELPGSAPNSLHMRGKAADFAVRGIPVNTVLAYVRTLPSVDEAYAIDDNFVHIGVLKY